MKKALSILTLGALFVLAGCQTAPEPQPDPKASKTVYQGVLPCADCSGIQTTLTLYRDEADKPSRFELRQKFMDGAKAGGSDVDRGNWIAERQSVDGKSYPLFILNPTDTSEQFRFLQKATNAVEMLNADGEPIESDFNYTLMQR